MDIQTAVTTVVTQKYADFTGRARRSEYWFYSLAYFVLSIVVSVIDQIIGSTILALIVGLALLIPSIAVGVRRLHDTGRSGWWLLIGIIPLIGWIVLIVFFVQDSEPGTNQYGPSPKGNEAFSGYGNAPYAG